MVFFFFFPVHGHHLQSLYSIFDILQEHILCSRKKVFYIHFWLSIPLRFLEFLTSNDSFSKVVE